MPNTDLFLFFFVRAHKLDKKANDLHSENQCRPGKQLLRKVALRGYQMCGTYLFSVTFQQKLSIIETTAKEANNRKQPLQDSEEMEGRREGLLL